MGSIPEIQKIFVVRTPPTIPFAQILVRHTNSTQISKIITLLYLLKNSQNKMELLMKQKIMETTNWNIAILFCMYSYKFAVKRGNG